MTHLNQLKKLNVSLYRSLIKCCNQIKSNKELILQQTPNIIELSSFQTETLLETTLNRIKLTKKLFNLGEYFVPHKEITKKYLKKIIKEEFQYHNKNNTIMSQNNPSLNAHISNGFLALRELYHLQALMQVTCVSTTCQNDVKLRMVFLNLLLL